MRLLKKIVRIWQLIHVYSHTGGNDWKSKWNDEADKLAKMGADHFGISDLISNGPVYASRGYSRPQMCMIRPICRCDALYHFIFPYIRMHNLTRLKRSTSVPGVRLVRAEIRFNSIIRPTRVTIDENILRMLKTEHAR